MKNAYSKRNEYVKRLGFHSYPDYLTSPLWQGIRSRVFQRDSKKCQGCGSPAECVHHTDYQMATLKGTKLDGVVALCHGCHKSVEYNADGSKTKNFKTVRRKTRELLAAHKAAGAPVNPLPAVAALPPKGVDLQEFVDGLTAIQRTELKAILGKSIEADKLPHALIVLDLKQIERFCTGRSGLKRRQALALGIGYPLKKGWKKRLIGTTMTNADYQKVFDLRRDF